MEAINRIMKYGEDEKFAYMQVSLPAHPQSQDEPATFPVELFEVYAIEATIKL